MANLTDVEQLLYTMLPPRRTFRKDTGETVMELVSAEPASRVEVAELHARLLERLRQRRARDSGVCPIRREIYAEVFDELIRQITIEEPVRGLLMLRVRDELYQTLAAHQSLAERSMYFAAKQRAEALDGLDVLQRRLQELEEERGLLLTKRRAVQVREEQLLHAIEEENVVRTKGRQDELGYYRRANRQLSQRIKAETERANAHGMAVNTVVLEAEGGEGTLPSAV
ncbi:putative 33 kDa inner dynein arm light chain, axonemal [Trypanosoma grayi]|uniref:putative 33 kDa inner dynein arm light chain, axonemal n=1 Tax=Trypanosoma grayi TaxID=71804 RepID=UPI0004F46115|nr:putative 33 kDa inner dynein arm light chain, axonemal [Trypanosoma grayi]KEG07969.1 putative 33 kDa inner dynein arm light chain, axonemal [Trypanosoma grayi]